MMRMNCLIVDDEPISREIIEGYCGHLPWLVVKGSCDNALKAKLILQQEKIDILFLDINMPVLDGISFLKTMKQPPGVIFTTAYKEYAVDAFDLAAVDYLLKPFSLERFIVAVDKAAQQLGEADRAVPAGDSSPAHFFVKTGSRIYKVAFDEVIYAEASGNYTRVVTTQHTLTTAMTFAALAALLPATAFIQVHRSFIVNKSRIDHIEGNRVYMNSTEIPLSSSYKEEFLRTLGIR